MRILIFSITVGIVLLSYFIWGFYYEAYQLFLVASFDGSITGNIPSDITTFVYLGIGGFLKTTYKLANHIACHDILSALLMLISTYIIFASLYRLPIKHTQLILLCSTIFFILIADNFIQQSYSRPAFLLCIAAFTHLNSTFTYNLSKTNAIISFFLMLTGVCLRFEVGALCCLLFTGYILLLSASAKSALKKLILFGVPTLLVLVWVAFIENKNNSILYKLHQKTEYELALGNIIPISQMKTAEDSVKYITAINGIKNDPGYLTLDFLESLIADKSLIIFSEARLSHAINELSKCYVHYQYLFWFNIVLLFLLVFLLYHKPVLLFKHLLFALFFFLMLFAISYFMLMEDRLFSPLLSFLALINLYSLFEYGLIEKMKPHRMAKWSVISVFFIFTLFSIQHLNAVSNAYKDRIRLNHIQFEALKKEAEGEVLAVGVTGFLCLFFDNYQPFQKADYSAFKNLFLLDIETFSLTPDYKRFLDKHCNCNSADLAAFYDYLYDHRDEVVIAGDTERTKVFEDYLRVVRKRSYRFVSVKQIPRPKGLDTPIITLYKISD